VIFSADRVNQLPATPTSRRVANDVFQRSPISI